MVYCVERLNGNVVYIYIWILLYVAFCTIMAILRQKEARSRDYALLLFRMTLMVLYSAQYHRQHCTLHAFEQFGSLYMHNHDDKYPSRPGLESGTPRLGYKPRSIWMSHGGRPRECSVQHDYNRHCADNVLGMKITDVCRRQIVTTEVDSRTVRVKIFIMAVDP